MPAPPGAGEAKPQEVMVLHTLVVDPQVKGQGLGQPVCGLL